MSYLRVVRGYQTLVQTDVDETGPGRPNTMSLKATGAVTIVFAANCCVADIPPFQAAYDQADYYFNRATSSFRLMTRPLEVLGIFPLNLLSSVTNTRESSHK